MNWKPVDIPPASTGSNFTYNVAKDKKNFTLKFSIAGALLKKMNGKDGALFRFDVATDTKQGRLIEVKAGRTARKIKVNELTGRGYFQIPWRGDPEKYMPQKQGPTELVVDQVTEAEGLIFQLP